MPGQEWYDAGCLVPSQMDDDFDFSSWNCDNSNDITCGWCPMEKHISPDKVYNHSLTNASENIRYLTPTFRLVSLLIFMQKLYG